MLDNRIRTFLALCQTMNYRAAAELLHITQPAVTQHIHALETNFGCKLFIYDGRKLTKTEQAILLERGAHAMIYQENCLRNALVQKTGRHLFIGATKTIGEYIIGDQVAQYLAHPGNQLSLDVDNTAHILSRLDRGELDFALIEGFFDRKAYASRLYRKEPFAGLCCVSHPLSGHTVPLEAVFEENLLLREEGSGTREILENLLHERSHTISDFRRVTCIANFGLIEHLTTAGCGITFAYAAVGGNNPKLAHFYIEGMDVRREFNYIYLPNCGAEEAVETFDAYRP